MTRITPTNKPIYYQLSQAGDIFATGQTIVGDVTATAASIVQSDDQNEFLCLIRGDGDAYPPLPDTGQRVEANQIYGYQGDCVLCRQSHARTIYPPEDTPALFSVYRSSGDATLEWIANENVFVGNIRRYDGIDYRCIQAHQTQADWTPPATPTLWALVVGAGEWQAGVAYEIGDVVAYNVVEYECLQAHTSQVGWEPPNALALWSEIL
jgi:hypothetical protein